MKHIIHDARMNEVDEKQELSLSYDRFHEAIIDLNKSKSEKYKFIIRGGKDLKYTLFKLFSNIWDTEKKSDQWRLDTLLQIHKNGSKLSLDNYRYIHVKEEIPKMFGYIVTKEIKSTI